MAPSILSYQRLKWHVLCISSVSQLASSESSNLPFWNPSSFSLCPALDPPPGGFGALGVEQIPKRPPTIRSSASGRTVNIFQDIAGQRRFHQDPTQHSPRDNGTGGGSFLLSLKYFGIGEVSSINGHIRGILMTGGCIPHYLIFVIFFTHAKFLENKIYTEIYTVNHQFTQ